MLDTSKIVGYDEMSAEEKVKALENFEIPIDDTETIKLKNALNKASAEASEWKKQFREKQTEQERAEAEAKEREEAIQKELASLRNEKAISNYKASYLSLGYDEDLALATAKAMVEGDTTTVFANQRIYNERKEAEYKSNFMASQPNLSVGSEPNANTITRAEIMAIKDTAKRQKMIAEHLDLFT